MDVKKMHDEAVIAQKANDAKGCNDKLAQAMQRAKIGTASMTMGTFSAMDKNNDGMISRDEYMSYRNSRFDERSGRTRAQHDANTRDMFARRDANNDGIISAAEFDRGLRRG